MRLCIRILFSFLQSAFGIDARQHVCLKDFQAEQLTGMIYTEADTGKFLLIWF